MSLLRLFYVASLGLLGVLLVITGLHAAVMSKGHTQVQIQLLEEADEWVTHFRITNREGRDLSYRIGVQVEGRPSSESAVIDDGATFTYIFHVQRDRLKTGWLSFAFYRDSEAKPVEEVTYYLEECQHGLPMQAAMEV